MVECSNFDCRGEAVYRLKSNGVGLNLCKDCTIEHIQKQGLTKGDKIERLTEEEIKESESR